MSGTVLIYGATGYTGKLIAKVAAGLGARPILAGRDLEKVQAIAAGTRLRRNGRIVTRIQAEEGSCDFGKGERPTVQVSWGDVSTAYHSTEIPNIEVQFEALPAIRRMTQTPAFIKSFLGLGFMQTFLKAQVDRMPEGPSEATRRAGQAVIVGEARNSDGQTVRSRLRRP